MALDIHKIRPDWLRSLANFTFDLVPLEATGKKAKKANTQEDKTPDVDAAPGDGTTDEKSAAMVAAPEDAKAAQRAPSETAAEAEAEVGVVHDPGEEDRPANSETDSSEAT